MNLSRRRHLWLFGLLALAAHVALFVAVTGRPRVEQPEPTLTGKFVKRLPVRRQVLRRSMSLPRPQLALRRTLAVPQAYARAVAPQARVAARPDVLHSGQMSAVLPRSMSTPGYGVSSMGRLQSRPTAIDMAAAHELNLGLELLDVDALDTGEYRALVVRDPGNPHALQGYVHLAAVGIRTAIRAAMDADQQANLLAARSLLNESAIAPDARHSADVRALDELAGALSAQTQLDATVDRDLYLGDAGWMDSPFVLLTGMADFVPAPAEVENLGRYLASGGFAYVEIVGFTTMNATIYGHVSDLPSLRGLIEQALNGQGLHRGSDWDIQPLPLEHPIFNSYYQIRNLPRPYWSVIRALMANGVMNYDTTQELYGWDELPPPHLEGVFVRGRLAGVYSQQNYRDLWSKRVERAVMSPNASDAHFYRQHLGDRSTGDLALRLGVNIVVDALTQEGSLARQYVVRN